MPIENLFKDCEEIAKKYEKHLIDVVIVYSHIELEYKAQMIDLNYDEILQKTEQFYKNSYVPKGIFLNPGRTKSRFSE